MSDDPTSSYSSTAAVLSDCDLLQEIFLRVSPATALIPVSVVCRTWHRILRSPAFWVGFSASRPPPLLGFYHNCDYGNRPLFIPALPSPPPPLRGLRSVDYRLSFLPGDMWEIRDSRDGLLLLFQPEAPGAPLKLVVYNPLTSHCLFIPLPDGEKSGGQGSKFLSSVFQHEEYLFDAALVTDGWTDGALLAPIEFRVVLVVSCFSELVVGAWVFSSANCSWSIVGYADIPIKPWFPGVVTIPSLNGVFYWLNRGDYILRIDFGTSELSIIEVSEEMLQRYGTNFELVGTEDDIALLGACGKELHLWVLTRNRSGVKFWKLRKTFDMQSTVDKIMTERGGLDADTPVMLEGIGERGGLVIVRIVEQVYTLHLKSAQLESIVTDTQCKGFSSFPYMMAWPPFMIHDRETDL